MRNPAADAAYAAALARRMGRIQYQALGTAPRPAPAGPAASGAPKQRSDLQIVSAKAVSHTPTRRQSARYRAPGDTVVLAAAPARQQERSSSSEVMDAQQLLLPPLPPLQWQPKLAEQGSAAAAETAAGKGRGHVSGQFDVEHWGSGSAGMRKGSFEWQALAAAQR